MSIAKRIAETFEKSAAGDPEAALIPACTAVDATAKREYPSLKSTSKRYKTFLHDNLWIIGLVGLRAVISPKISLGVHHPDLKPDNSGMCEIKDVLYHVIRCGLIHEATIDKYVSFHPNKFGYDEGKYILPESLPLGLAFAVVLSPRNRMEKIGRAIQSRIGKAHCNIDELWGAKNAIIELFNKGEL